MSRVSQRLHSTKTMSLMSLIMSHIRVIRVVSHVENESRLIYETSHLIAQRLHSTNAKDLSHM